MAGLAMLRLGGESAFVFVMVQAAEYRVCPIPWPQPTTVCCSGSGAIFEALPLSKQVAQSGVVLAVNVFHASKLRQTQSNATHLTISFFHFFFRYSLTFPSRGAAKRGNIRFVYERIGQIRLLWLLLISWRSGQYRTDRNRTEPDPEPNRTGPRTEPNRTPNRTEPNRTPQGDSSGLRRQEGAKQRARKPLSQQCGEVCRRPFFLTEKLRGSDPTLAPVPAPILEIHS